MRFWAIGLGGLAGFLSLTKFTLAVCTIGPLVLLLLLNFFKPTGSEPRNKTNFLAITDAIIGILTISLIFSEPNPLHGLAKVLVCFLGAGLVGYIGWLSYPLLARSNWFKIQIPSLIQKLMIKKEFKPIKAKFNRLGLSSYVFYITYLTGLLVYVFIFSSLIPFLRGALEISSGYSSIMISSTNNGLTELIISIFVLIAAYFILLAVLGNSYLALPLLLVLFVSFKHSVVRQDAGHIWSLAVIAPFLVAVCIARVPRVRLKKFSCLFYGSTLVFFYLISTFTPLPANGNTLEPKAAIQNLLNITVHLNRAKSDLQAASMNYLAQERLPAEVLEAIGNQSIDIFPDRTSLVAANPLNWQPRPVFQSYAAYTTFLDNKNFESLSQKPRDFILYSFHSIDSRHPFFDEPKTFFYLFCNYQFSSKIPNQIQEVTLLKRRSHPICALPLEGQNLLVQMNTPQPVELNNPLVNRAEIKFKYSWFGRLCKIFFRTASIRMQVNYVDGTQSTYRVVQDNAQNGILVSHLPRNKEEASSLFQGKLTAQVKSFQFFTDNPWLYRGAIEVRLLPYRISD
ncbi:hypothetical protein K9N68_00090 [Kovacikia minuta CCNUW1]|uniref:hypothetical protein n=1 Tax=Kovacikia minuta TaxID=2931930 RepID=UPI001CCD61EB|nr:hypothetical protein [Kovacikia minuta]UBF26457.1 hypothetical protein K9N68_00090 [Kovacikia minuta CCNUW1]